MRLDRVINSGPPRALLIEVEEQKLRKTRRSLDAQARKAALYQKWIPARIAQRVADSPILYPPPLGMEYRRQGYSVCSRYKCVTLPRPWWTSSSRSHQCRALETSPWTTHDIQYRLLLLTASPHLSPKRDNLPLALLADVSWPLLRDRRNHGDFHMMMRL